MWRPNQNVSDTNRDKNNNYYFDNKDLNRTYLKNEQDNILMNYTELITSDPKNSTEWKSEISTDRKKIGKLWKKNRAHLSSPNISFIWLQRALE